MRAEHDLFDFTEPKAKIAMAFLTKKEQTVIRLINAKEALKPTDREVMVHNISYNARLRQDGHRMPVREFIQAMADHNSEKVLRRII